MATKSNEIRSIDMTLDASDIKALVVEDNAEIRAQILAILRQVVPAQLLSIFSSAP